MKRIFILISLFLTANLGLAQKVMLELKPDAVYFLEGKDSILKYQVAEKSLNGKYKRSNYIHPLYALGGDIITEDFPKDHLHHRGIFWAWHQIYIGKTRLGDAWEIKDFSWDITSVNEIEEKQGVKAIQAEVFWKSPLWLERNGKEKPIVKETTTIKVYPKKKNYRQIDITISMLALEKNIRIGGSEDEKGYGGFSQRVKLTDDIVFSGPIGKVTPKTIPVKVEGWLDISGSFGNEERKSGLTILSHPNNPGYPNPWILRTKSSMQNAVYPFPGASAIHLPEDKPTILKYSLIIHDGSMKPEVIESIFNAYKKT